MHSQRNVEATKHPLYNVWRGMRRRCDSPGATAYKDYGGRGITVCERWNSDFWAFVEDMGVRPVGFTLDRLDVDGNYEPSNCEWRSQKTQQRNRRDNNSVIIDGIKKPLVDWVEHPECKVTLSTVKRRLSNGWNNRDAVFIAPDTSPRSKLRRVDIDYIKELSRLGHTQTSIAKEFGVSRSNIGHILSGITWT